MTESNRPAPRHLAAFAIAHALLLIGFLSWRFGGMEPLARSLGEWLCLPAPVITFLAWRAADRPLRRAFLRIALPLAVLLVVILASLANPNMRPLLFDGEVVLAPREHVSFLPSTARPAEAFSDLKLDAALILVGLNLFLARPGRRLQRFALWSITVNAAVLACVGTVYKLEKATQILGLYASPNERFFATFIYYNHWGAFAVLGMATAGALLFSYRRQAAETGWQHTPAPVLAIIIALLFVTLPLSTARASTLAGLILLATLAFRFILRRQGGRSSGSTRVIAVSVASLAMLAAAGWLGRDAIRFQLTKTSGQLANLRGGGFADARLPVYRDTIKLWLEAPVYGWGWHSYRYAFRRVQSISARMQNEQRVDSVFLDAHNDWLQLLAELGLVGAALTGAATIGIARTARWREWMRTPSFELAAGAGCIGILALVDFPFACPVVILTWWTVLMIGAAIAFERATAPVPAPSR